MPGIRDRDQYIFYYFILAKVISWQGLSEIIPPRSEVFNTDPHMLWHHQSHPTFDCKELTMGPGLKHRFCCVQSGPQQNQYCHAQA